MGYQKHLLQCKGRAGKASFDDKTTPDNETNANPLKIPADFPRTRATASDIPLTRQNILFLQKTIGNHAVEQLIQTRRRSDRPDGQDAVLQFSSVQSNVEVSQPNDVYEQEADRVAARVVGGPDRAAVQPPQQNIESGQNLENRLSDGGGSPLPDDVRAKLEPRFGADFSHVRVHTGAAAVQMNRDLNAEAFTYGQNIYFGSGRYPGNNALTAHELTHVIQQTGGAQNQSISGPINTQIGTKRIQCSFTATYPVTQGAFEVDLQTREGAVNTPPTHSGMDGYIRFVPDPAAPNSNQIVFVQIVRTTDLGGADINSASTPAAQAPRGALGQPGLRTQEDPARGVEGGFKTDVHHRPSPAAPGVPQGTALSPRYNFQPAAPGAVGTVGQVAQPAIYGGGIGGVVGQTPGFKRSSDPADIRSAVMYDQPGVADPSWNLNMSFESVAKSEDTMTTYGAVKWGFGLRAGRVVNEYLNPVDAQSATFDEALERHRDFYVHEPVTFYFAFDRDILSATEASKIDTFLAYLGRNPDVHMSIEGFADIRGGVSTYNASLSLRRAEAVESALLAKGIAAGRIDGIIIGHGASTSATTDAGTGDQGGAAAVGADQNREANRWANRRVVLTFRHVPAAAPAPGGGP